MASLFLFDLLGVRIGLKEVEVVDFDMNVAWEETLYS